MYGLDEKTDLRFLANRKILEIQTSDFQAQIHLDENVTISIESAISVDGKRYVDMREINLVLACLAGAKVAHAVNFGNGDISLQLADRRILTIYDSNRDFESYSITWNGGTIIV